MGLSERLATAWNTLWDKEQAGMLLQGPLPLWIQDEFEREAKRLGVPVGDVIYGSLRVWALKSRRARGADTPYREMMSIERAEGEAGG